MMKGDHQEPKKIYLLLIGMFLELCQVVFASETKCKTELLPMWPRTKAVIGIC